MTTVSRPVTVPLPPHLGHPFAPAGRANPGPAYRWLQLHDPVHYDPYSRMWWLTSHAACGAALRDHRLSAALGQRERARDDALPPSMLTTDPPEHQRLRNPGQLLLGPAAIRSLEGVLGEEIDALIGALPDRFDAVEAIGAPFATAVFGRLFGLPRTDWARFELLAGAASVNLDPLAGSERAAAGRAAMGELSRFLTAHARTAVAGPLGRLMADDRITEREKTGILGLAVVGGWQPLAEMVGNALYWLLPRPEAVAVLHGSGGDTGHGADGGGAARLLVDELLRLEAPIPFTARVATEEVPLPGGTVPRDGRVLIIIAAANRDPAAFEDPDELRPGRTPNPQLAFGAGTHFCLAAQLVRTAGALLLPRLLGRFPGLALTTAPDALAWDPSPIPRRLLSCPVTTTGSADAG
ncbi:cytochrome P450 [Streptomyces sp. NPDC051320]|uniref:cytochrome P450 n=1 Tax=Streptomyces sp. NPDC051320 TaxID=3154644 RepID=UPI003446EACE